MAPPMIIPFLIEMGTMMSAAASSTALAAAAGEAALWGATAASTMGIAAAPVSAISGLALAGGLAAAEASTMVGVIDSVGTTMAVGGATQSIMSPDLPTSVPDSPLAPQAVAAPVMPTMDSAAIEESRRRSYAVQQQRGGRTSTMMSAGDSLGGGL